MSFFSAVDIANRAIQHVGARRIVALTDVSKPAGEINFCYDKLRRAELRRSVWRFATRRCTIRPVTSTSKMFVPAVYAGGTTYGAGIIVQDGSGAYWISLQAGNVGNTPGSNTPGFPPYWAPYFGQLVADAYNSGVIYNAGELVYVAGSPDVWYVSLENNNVGHAVGSFPWTASLGTTTDIALPLLQPYGPLNSGAIQGLPVNTTQNLFPLPYGYLRLAPQPPRVASTSTLTTTAGIPYTDWQFEGNFIVSATASVIALRYVADVSYVPDMDDLYCEGLAARIGYEICESITQSNAKLQAIGAAYQKFINEARLINWLENGSTEDQEPDHELSRSPQGLTDASRLPPQGGGR